MRFRARAIAAVVLCAVVSAACVTLHTRTYTPATALPQLIGPHGPISEPAANAIIEKTLGARSQADEALVSAVRQNAGAPLTTGNQIELLIDGPQTFAAMEQAIAEARHSVHVEMYIYADDELGQRPISICAASSITMKRTP